MAKYRKLPVVIDAERWWPGKPVAGVEAVIRNVPVFDEFDYPTEVVDVVRTRKGDLKVSPGDWIITGIGGERWPCKDEIFRVTYELAEEE